MIRKIQTNRDLAFVFIPKAFIELLDLHKGQKVDVRVVDEKIVIVPIQTAKPKLSRNVQVNEGGKATSGNRSPIIEAQDNGKITTGDNSPINQENIFIQLFWSKGTIGGAIIVIVLNIIYYFWRKKKKTLYNLFLY